MAVSTKRRNVSKSKSNSLSKSNKGSSSRKHLNKSRKSGSKTRKMRGGHPTTKHTKSKVQKLTNYVKKKLTIEPGSRANQMLPFKGYRQRRREQATVLPPHSPSQQVPLQVPSGTSSAASTITKLPSKLPSNFLSARRGISGISGEKPGMYLPPVTQVIPEPPVAEPKQNPIHYIGEKIPNEVKEDPSSRMFFGFGRGGDE
jgi:hypothetical protein